LPLTIAGTEQDGKVGVRIVVEKRIIDPAPPCGEGVRPAPKAGEV